VTPEPTTVCQMRRAHAPWRRFAPLIVVVLAMAAVFATGAHRHVSLETLIHHRMAIEAFIDSHALGAVAAFMAIYILTVALSIPGGLFLTISGGVLFGTALGGVLAVISGTTGATILFVVARNACGESLIRRGGPLASRLAEGFRADAFNYLLFLRLIPAFPFFLVNIVPALVGVKLTTFVGATLLGVIPATFAFAFFGASLDSIIAAQEQIFRDCLASGRTDCVLQFDIGMILTPRLFAALGALALIALIPVVVKRVKRMRAGRLHSHPAPLS
jgi:uncharacterized membrane protein YdjX (TVP38/TMEM64 family)